jgi:hypothetical protein
VLLKRRSFANIKTHGVFQVQSKGRATLKDLPKASSRDIGPSSPCAGSVWLWTTVRSSRGTCRPAAKCCRRDVLHGQIKLTVGSTGRIIASEQRSLSAESPAILPERSARDCGAGRPQKCGATSDPVAKGFSEKPPESEVAVGAHLMTRALEQPSQSKM